MADSASIFHDEARVEVNAIKYETREVLYETLAPKDGGRRPSGDQGLRYGFDKSVEKGRRTLWVY